MLDRLGLECPIIQAPMGGGFTTPALVAAVSNAGGLGSVGSPYMEPQTILDEAAAVRRLTDRPFAMNLFVFDLPEVTEADVARVRERLAPFCRELAIDLPELTGPPHPDIAEQIEAVLEARPAVFSFTFGIPKAEVLRRCRELGILTVGTATTLAEALALEAAGVDAVCVQGSEAGAHRGTFLGPWQEGMIGLLPLVDLVSSRLRAPVIAAGGIMTGRAATAAMGAGAAAVQLGTAFLTCPEAGTPALHKEALLAPGVERTGITLAYSGRAARGLISRYTETMAGEPPAPFPVLNAMTRGLRAAAAAQGRTEFMSLWAGQGAPLARAMPAAELVGTLRAEMGEA